MTAPKPIRPGEVRVRIILRGGFTVHVITSTPPEMTQLQNGRWRPLRFDLIEGHPDGDNIAAIDWDEVAAVTYRA